MYSCEEKDGLYKVLYSRECKRKCDGVKLNGFCLDECDKLHPYIKDKQCVKQCATNDQGHIYYNENKECLDTCDETKFFTINVFNEHRLCKSECNESELIVDGS